MATSSDVSVPQQQHRRVHAITLVAGLAFAFAGCRQIPTAPLVAFAPGARLSEKEAVRDELQRSLSAFLEPLCRGEWNDEHTDPDDRERYAFFFKSLQRGARDAEPIILKSHPLDEGAHMVTVAFVNGLPDAMAISRIVELEAVPTENGFQFRSPYERNTAHLQRRMIGDVTYRFSGPFNEERAAEFTRFKTKFDALQGIEPEPLQYDCFQSLDQLLKAYGLVHDASKCNFLRHDLGFLWHDGQRFATGTGDESYIFGYVSGVLSARATASSATYWPYLNGVAAYYGGYGLSGDSMETLARQFREELERRPLIDFLEEFEKGRASSVQRHFSHYVMCAFLCQEIAARHGEATALRLVDSGAGGERFFNEIEALIGVTRQNFHATIMHLIGAHE